MAKFNPHANGDVFQWNESTGKDGQYVGRIDSDGDFVMPNGMIPQNGDDATLAAEVKTDIREQYESGSGWEKSEWPEEILKFAEIQA